MPVDRAIEKVQLFFAAKNLPNMQMFNKTDAFLGVLLHDRLNNNLRLVALTEVIRDNHSPQWTKTHTMDYLFETVQVVSLRVFQQGDLEAPLQDLAKHTVIGEATFRMSDLMKNAHRLSLPISRLDGSATEAAVEVSAEPVVDSRDVFCVKLHGSKLPNKDGFFNTSDPFHTISRLNEDGTYSLVHRSEVVDNDLSPKWQEAKIPLVTLCNCDLDRPLLIEIRDQDSDGKSQSMGSVKTTARALLGSNAAPLNVIEDKKKDTKGYVNSGTLTANHCRVEHHPTFAQFLMGGLEVSLVVAIDFTGSNGDPVQSTSLHHIDPSGAKLNAYEEAISAVGRVLEPYDKDKQYPVYGFGARVKNGDDGSYTPVQHCFPVNPKQFEAHGVDGVLSTYRSQVGELMFSGPTLIAPLIERTAANAQCVPGNQKYTVLLILTDGTINDMDEAKAALIAASHKPISVIIVGVGSADFTDMKALDSDKKALTAGGQTAVRDVVQFVTYNEAAAQGASVLAQQVLAEVPDQVLQFMEKNGILPGAKR